MTVLYPGSFGIWSVGFFFFVAGGKPENLEKALEARREATANSAQLSAR